MDRAKPGGIGGSEPPGSDFLQLDIAAAPRGGRADWLTGQLRRAIADGRLPAGSRLPASRVLAAELHVSRGVVTEAYRRLADDGHVEGNGRDGTRVMHAPAEVGPVVPAPGPAGSVFPAVPGPDVFDRMRAAPARIDLSPGVPDLAAFPRSGWLRAERMVLGRLAASGLGYGDPTGEPAVRVAIAGWLARNRGVRADPGEVIVVAGAAQGLGLLAQVLRERQVSAVAVEDPGSLGIRQHLANWRFATPPVPVDGAGLRVDQLRDTGAGVALLTPAHQFPTGVVLTPDRRAELGEWARAGGLVVHGVEAGLHLLVSLPGGPPDTEIAERALERGVKVQPLSWHRQCPGPPGLVLGYAARTVTEIQDAVAVLGSLVRQT